MPSLPPVVSAAEWRQELALVRAEEKEMTRRLDKLSARRRRLPMTPVAGDYEFTCRERTVTLLELFEGRSQLIVYHFMFGPDWDAGCPGCSWVVDAMTHPAHFHARDTSFLLASRASVDKIEAYRTRMGWDLELRWCSTQHSDFNVDMGATVNGDEHHGVSVFLRDGERVYRTYHTGDRGVESLGSHWTWLDLTPYGRQEEWEDSPAGWPQSATYGWQRRHDEYDL